MACWVMYSTLSIQKHQQFPEASHRYPEEDIGRTSHYTSDSSSPGLAEMFRTCYNLIIFINSVNFIM